MALAQLHKGMCAIAQDGGSTPSRSLFVDIKDTLWKYDNFAMLARQGHASGCVTNWNTRPCHDTFGNEALSFALIEM